VVAVRPALPGMTSALTLVLTRAHAL